METSKAHSRPGCSKYLHIICGRADADNEEGIGSMFWCPSCDVREQNKIRNSLRLDIKRNQESLPNRIISSSSNKRSKSVVEVGESVLIPIARPDTMSSIGPRNITGCITGR